jgi:Cu(I)/Ag(I) efflux system membrane fusion protein
MKKNTVFISVVLLILIIAGIYYVMSGGVHRPSSAPGQVMPEGSQPEILYYTCGMHPSVKVSPQEYKQGNTNCPICQMALTPVYRKPVPTQMSPDMDMSGDMVMIDPKELIRIGAETTPVKVVPLFKEIRTVGVVAYDPRLRTAEEEYLQAYQAYQKIAQSPFSDAADRAEKVLAATKTKLQLLGVDSERIKALEPSQTVSKNLILPDDSMWIYADIYESQSSWPRIGDEAMITVTADPSLSLTGQIKSIEPVMNENTRTIRLHILVENEGHFLIPNMYVDVFLRSELGPVLAIPRAAVLDTGTRKIMYVETGPGQFQKKEVETGPLAQGTADKVTEEFYPLISGAEEGDLVVVKGNFLIDSQSQLGAAASGFGGALGHHH